MFMHFLPQDHKQVSTSPLSDRKKRIDLHSSAISMPGPLKCVCACEQRHLLVCIIDGVLITILTSFHSNSLIFMKTHTQESNTTKFQQTLLYHYGLSFCSVAIICTECTLYSIILIPSILCLHSPNVSIMQELCVQYTNITKQ